MRHLGWCFGIPIATIALIRIVTACTPAQSAESLYSGALLRCVDKSETLAESKACRAQVNAQFGVDGGSK